MAGEGRQHLRPRQPVFKELGGQFDEVGGDVGAGEAGIGDVRQHAVQRVAELVEQRAGVVEGQQRRLALGEVHHIDDDRADVALELLLRAEARHPGAGALGGPAIIVAEEQRDVAAVLGHLEGAHIGVIGRNVRPLGEGEAEQAGGGVERCRDHLIERQIRLGRRLIQIETGLAQLLGIVPPVPRRDGAVEALRLRKRLEIIALALGAGLGRRPHLFQQGAHRRGRFRHGVVELEGGEGRVAEQAGALQPERHHLGDQCAIVGGAARFAAADPGFIGGLAQIAAGGEGEERLDRGARQRDQRRTRPAALLAGIEGGLDDEIGQAGAVVLGRQLQRPGRLVGQHVLGELGAEAGQPLDDGVHPRLGVGRELGAGADEGEAGALQQAPLLVIEAVLVGLQRVDALKQPGVGVDGRAMGCELGRDVALDGLQRVVGIGAGEVEEHVGDAIQQPRAILQAEKRGLEPRRGGVLDQRRDLAAVGRQGGLEGRGEMLWANLGERRHRERGGPVGKQRVRGRCGVGQLKSPSGFRWRSGRWGCVRQACVSASLCSGKPAFGRACAQKHEWPGMNPAKRGQSYKEDYPHNGERPQLR